MIKLLTTEIDAHGRRNLWRGYASSASRKRAISLLKKAGLNYFVCYRDTNAEFALQATTANWVIPGCWHLER